MTSFRIGALAAALGVALTACSSNPGGPFVAATVYSNLAGDYSGTMDDAQSGNGTASATLAQTGNAVGGTITDTGASTNSATISLTISSANVVTGSIVIDYAGGTTCTFSTSGSYDTSTNVLSGSYTAVKNCSGDSGTYSLTQQCTDPVAAGARRDKTGGLAPC